MYSLLKHLIRLLLAAKNGSFETCEMLIDTIKHILLQRHPCSNNTNLLINQYLSLILKKNIDKRTPVHEAAKTGNLVILDFFFRMINDTNISNEYEQHKIALCEDSDDELKTSLHLASAEGKFQLTIQINSFRFSFPKVILKSFNY
jgi:hypothetical protein